MLAPSIREHRMRVKVAGHNFKVNLEFEMNTSSMAVKIICLSEENKYKRMKLN